MLQQKRKPSQSMRQGSLTQNHELMRILYTDYKPEMSDRTPEEALRLQVTQARNRINEAR